MITKLLHQGITPGVGADCDGEFSCATSGRARYQKGLVQQLDEYRVLCEIGIATLSDKFCDHKSACGCTAKVKSGQKLCDRCARGECGYQATQHTARESA